MHARTKGQGMETNPLHALRTGQDSVARCNHHMLINNMFYPPSSLGFAGATANKKMKGTWELGLLQSPEEAFVIG